MSHYDPCNPCACPEMTSRSVDLSRAALIRILCEMRLILKSLQWGITEELLVDFAPSRPVLASGVSSLIIAENTTNRAGKSFIDNYSGKTVWVNIGAPALIGQGHMLQDGDAFLFPTGQALYGIQNSGDPVTLEVFEAISISGVPDIVTFVHTRPVIAAGVSSLVIAANPLRRTRSWCELTQDVTVWVNFGVPAVLGEGHRMKLGDALLFPTAQALYAIQDSGSPINLEVFEAL